MVCLDTNYLILALVSGSREAARITAWCKRGEVLVAPAVVWYEFICGPVDAGQIALIRALLQDVLPFDETQAREAAIAAAATSRNASLATGNTGDYSVFVDSGLKLVETSESG